MKNKRIIFAVLLLLLLQILLSACVKVDDPEYINAVFNGREIEVTWQNVTEADYYRLYRKGERDENFRFIGDFKVNTFLDSEIISSELYTYKVKSVTSSKESEGALSEAVFVSPGAEITAIVNTDGVISIEWTDSDADYYILQGKAGEIYEEILSTSDTSAEFDNRGYSSFRVISVTGNALISSDEVLNLDKTEITSVTFISRNTCAVIYDKVDGASYYKIYRSEDSGESYSEIGTSYYGVFYDEHAYYHKEFCYRVQPCASKVSGELSDSQMTELNKKSTTSVPVLMYHRFVSQEDLDNGYEMDQYDITVEELEQDFIYLKDHGYNSISCEQLIDYLEGKSELPENPILITIDDGKYTVYKNAFPLFVKYDMKGTLNVIGDGIDEATENPTDRDYSSDSFCTWDELKEMSDSGFIEITSHTYYQHKYAHDDGRSGADIDGVYTLDEFSSIAFDDFMSIKNKITKEIGKFIPVMAYPYSKRSDESDKAWFDAGYKLLLAGDTPTVKHDKINYFIRDLGTEGGYSVLRRIPREPDFTMEYYLEYIGIEK